MKSLGLIKASLDGYKIVITGAGTGIGFSTSCLFADLGASVALNYLPEDNYAMDSVNLLKNKFSKVYGVPGDVSDELQAKKVIKDSCNFLNGIDWLVNNAGISLVEEPIPFSDLDKIDDNFWDQIISVNLMSAFYCSKAAALELKKTRGAIVNISSVASNGKRGTSIPYSVSKGALETLTISLAKALAPEIRVNAVAPGFTNTRMTSTRSEEHKNRMREQTLLYRIAQPEEIAEVILFLCVSGSYVNGEIINVNGGQGYIY